MKESGPTPHGSAHWPAAKSLSHLCRKYRRLCRFCRLSQLVSAVPSIICGSSYGMEEVIGSIPIRSTNIPFLTMNLPAPTN